MDTDEKKWYSCTPKYRCIIIGWCCFILYAVTLGIAAYIISGDRLPDIVLKLLLIGLPFMLVFISMLIYGVYKDRPNFMLPWLVVKFLTLVMFSIFLVFFLGITIVSFITKEHMKRWIPFLTTLLSVCISWFFHWYIYKYYKSITEEHVL